MQFGLFAPTLSSAPEALSSIQDGVLSDNITINQQFAGLVTEGLPSSVQPPSGGSEFTLGEQTAPEAKVIDIQVSSGTALPQVGVLPESSGNLVPSPNNPIATPQTLAAGMTTAEVERLPSRDSANLDAPPAKGTVPIMRTDLSPKRPAEPSLTQPVATQPALERNPAKPVPLEVPVSRVLKEPEADVQSPRSLPAIVPMIEAEQGLNRERSSNADHRELHRQLVAPFASTETEPSVRTVARPAAPTLNTPLEQQPEGRASQLPLNEQQNSALQRSAQPAPPATVPQAISAPTVQTAAIPLPQPIEAAPNLRDAAPLERLVETITQMRETGQSGRAEVSLRHGDFGTISMRVMADEGELQARLTSRDPGFLAAAQNALAEKPATDRVTTTFHEPAQPNPRGQDGTPTGQNNSRGSGGLADQGQTGDHAASAHSGSTRGEHGAGNLSADDHTRPNSDLTDRRGGGLFA